ncbi:MAG: TBC domain-containing protein [archaeon]|nr:TBC domain-containing protein [archaeon]
MEYYMEFSGLMTDCALVLPFIEKFVPEVYQHINKLNVQMCLTNLLYRWFISLFVENMHINIWLPIWDLMMIEGNIVLIKAAILIILLAKDEILQKKDMGEISTFFDEEIRNFNSPEFLEMLINRKFTLNTRYLNLSREKNLPKIIDSIKKNKEKPINIKEEECNIEWPLCVCSFSDIAFKRVFVTKVFSKPNIDNNFFDYKENINHKIHKFMEKEMENELNNRNEEEDLKKRRIFKNILFYRANHVCGNNSSLEKSEISGIERESLQKSLRLFGSILEEKKEVDNIKIIDEIEKSNLEDNKSNAILNGSLFISDLEEEIPFEPKSFTDNKEHIFDFEDK